jgi:hypothetical protein
MNSKSLILIIMSLLLVKIAHTQTLVDDTKTYEILVFENFEKEQTKFIRSGARIKYKLYSNPKYTYKGVIEKITDKSMFVDGQEVKISDCSMIAGRVRTDKEIIGGLLLGVGVATAPFGVAIINLNAIAGPILAGAGIAAVVTGVYFITQKKKFKMARGWTVHGGKLTFSMTQN